MTVRDFMKAGHTPTLLCAFLYFDVSFMVWVLLGALANSRGHRHEENAARLVNVALEQPPQVAAALLASAEGYTPTAQQLIERARERIGSVAEVADALAENLPQPKAPSGKSRRRRRRRKRDTQGADGAAPQNGEVVEAVEPVGAEQPARPAAHR